MRVGKSYPNPPVGRDVCLTGDEDGLAETSGRAWWLREGVAAKLSRSGQGWWLAESQEKNGNPDDFVGNIFWCFFGSLSRFLL